MGKVSYNQEAVELCRKLYCKYGGKNHLAIENEMRKQYPSWRMTNLYDRGKTKERHGWVTRFGFDNSLKLHLQKLVESVNDDEQGLYLEVKAFRAIAYKRAMSADSKRDDVYLYRDFVKLTIEALKALDLSKDNLETFVACYEKLINWLGDIDPAAAKVVIKHGEKLTQLAQAHYGKAEAVDDGASDREDEGGE